MADNPIDLGAVLRALRRRADLSQRELAEKAGVPASTVGNVEAGRVTDPRFRTVERLAAAAGVLVEFRVSGERVGEVLDRASGPAELRDRADRRYPAHLEVRPVLSAEDWWGCYMRRPRGRSTEPPRFTFDRNRDIRDARRWRTTAEIDVLNPIRTRRLMPGDERALDPLPRDAAVRYLASPDVHHLAARCFGFGVVGHLAARLCRDPRAGVEQLIIVSLDVDERWRDQGVVLALLVALLDEADRIGVSEIVATAKTPADEEWLRRLGFRRCPAQPVWLELPA